MAWRRPKKIEDASKFDQGVTLYIEEGDIKEKMETFKWHQEFMKELDKIVLNMNDPTIDPTATVFAVRIEMRKHNTLLELKEKIGEMYNLKIGDFAIKRFMVSREYKNLDAKLSEMGLTNSCNIQIVVGKAHQDGVFELQISAVKLLETSEQDDILFSKSPLFKLVIDPTISVIELKSRILKEYNNTNPDNQLAVEDIRLRNPKLDDLGEVIHDCEILENYHLFDEKEIHMQILDKNRSFDFINVNQPDNCYHILLREWNPETWELGPVMEVRLDKS